MNIFDVVIAVILIIAFVRGFIKGFFVEIASLIALIGGVYGAIHFSYFAANILKKYVDWSENYIALTAFAVTFIIIVIAVSSFYRKRDLRYFCFVCTCKRNCSYDISSNY